LIIRDSLAGRWRQLIAVIANEKTSGAKALEGTFLSTLERKVVEQIRVYHKPTPAKQIVRTEI